MGFSTQTGAKTFVYADNISVDGSERDGGFSADGELLIGNTASESPKIGRIKSTDTTVQIVYNDPDIDVSVPDIPLVPINNGELLVGNSVTSKAEIGNLVSPDGSIIIGYANPDITLETSSSSSKTIEITSNTTAVPDTTYITNSVSRINVELPSSVAIGEFVEVLGFGAGGWRITQPANVIIHFNDRSSTVGATGYMQSSQRYNAIRLKALSTTEWLVVSASGSITIF